MIRCSSDKNSIPGQVSELDGMMSNCSSACLRDCTSAKDSSVYRNFQAKLTSPNKQDLFDL